MCSVIFSREHRSQHFIQPKCLLRRIRHCRKIMNKYLHMELGKAMSLSGMCVALSAALVYDKKTVVLSILGTYFNGIILDHFIFNHNIKRRVCIITEKEEELRLFILMISTAVRPFTNPSVPTICRSGMRLLQL